MAQPIANGLPPQILPMETDDTDDIDPPPTQNAQNLQRPEDIRTQELFREFENRLPAPMNLDDEKAPEQ